MIYVKEKISCTARAFAFFLYARWGHSKKSLMPVDVVYNQATHLWEMDIHNYKARLERSIRRVQTSYEISEENKEVILKFKDYLLSEGIGAAKIDRYLSDCIKYSRMLRKPFGNATKEDIRKVVAEIEQSELSAETSLQSGII